MPQNSTELFVLRWVSWVVVMDAKEMCEKEKKNPFNVRVELCIEWLMIVFKWWPSSNRWQCCCLSWALARGGRRKWGSCTWLFERYLIHEWDILRLRDILIAIWGNITTHHPPNYGKYLQKFVHFWIFCHKVIIIGGVVGDGIIFNPKIYIADFEIDKKKSNFRV